MSEQLAQAKRWVSEAADPEAADLLLDLPDPCQDVDRVATIVNALTLSVAAIIQAIATLEERSQ